ncbi:hypothetical protein BU23DRAFT_295892 [Bimuria novae-zelandiae CBS 107.79]|uniref:Uncharacterized protein n=1 Tax=Bimuria novae-zelandiae CBS 107.79 TaxID=1447943 RepID=A0A6A5VW43_9PLEO|nr:hypothetical protein BU23DRAFT_295892 [Bimuria novae-zelandiae CBS 107.79]
MDRFIHETRYLSTTSIDVGSSCGSQKPLYMHEGFFSYPYHFNAEGKKRKEAEIPLKQLQKYKELRTITATGPNISPPQHSAPPGLTRSSFATPIPAHRQTLKQPETPPEFNRRPTAMLPPPPGPTPPTPPGPLPPPSSSPPPYSAYPSPRQQGHDTRLDAIQQLMDPADRQVVEKARRQREEIIALNQSLETTQNVVTEKRQKLEESCQNEQLASTKATTEKARADQLEHDFQKACLAHESLLKAYEETVTKLETAENRMDQYREEVKELKSQVDHLTSQSAEFLGQRDAANGELQRVNQQRRLVQELVFEAAGPSARKRTASDACLDSGERPAIRGMREKTSSSGGSVVDLTGDNEGHDGVVG